MKIKFEYFSWPSDCNKVSISSYLPDISYSERGTHPYYIFLGPFSDNNCDVLRCKDVLLKIKMIEDGQLIDADFSEESWCVDIKKDFVEISFSQDWSFCSKYPLWQFKKALVAWIDFIQMPREANGSLEIDL